MSQVEQSSDISRPQGAPSTANNVSYLKFMHFARAFGPMPRIGLVFDENFSHQYDQHQQRTTVPQLMRRFGETFFEDHGRNIRAPNIKLQQSAQERRATVQAAARRISLRDHVLVSLPARLGFRRGLLEMDLVIDPLDPGQRNEVMLAARRLIGLGQLDLIGAFHVIDGADMNAVGTHDLHVRRN